MAEPAKDGAQVAKDLAAGCVGGVAQVLVGQPFDTIKTRLQTMPAPRAGVPPLYTGTVDCVSKTVRNEGVMALYKGTTTPLIGIGACVAIQFGALESMKRFFNEQNLKASSSASSASASSAAPPLTLGQLYLAGAVAGMANSIVSGPVEHIRIRLQVQGTSTSSSSSSSAAAGASAGTYFRGPVDAVRQIYGKHGLAGIYKGQAPTLLREFHGYGCYFLAYEYLYQNAVRKNQRDAPEKPAKPGMVQVMTFGALAGYALWIAVYPIDVIKSKMQTDAFNSAEARYKGMMDCARVTLREEGMGGFFKGIVPCLLRAAPVNAATFLAFDWAIRELNKL